MPRLSTRRKRVLQVGVTSQKHRFYKSTEKKSRMKSFKTEESARSWAKAQKLDEKTHELRPLQPAKWQWRVKNPRFQ